MSKDKGAYCKLTEKTIIWVWEYSLLEDCKFYPSDDEWLRMFTELGFSDAVKD